MISSEVFTIDWIYSKVNNLKKASKNIDPILLEKVTKAIYLLECLTNSKLEFTFKGGTSVILLLGNAKHIIAIYT